MVNKIIGVVVLILGAFLTFAPHEIHLSLGLNFDHIYHVSFGIILLILSGYLLTKKAK